jgi:hypothetical protein
MKRYGNDLLMPIYQLADITLALLDSNYPLHHLLVKEAYSFSDSSDTLKLELIHLFIGRKSNVNQENALGVCPLEALLNHAPNIDHVMLHLRAGTTSTRILSGGKTAFDLIDERIEASGHYAFTKAILEFDLACQPQIINLATHAAWTATWRAACNEPRWGVAKYLLNFENSYPRPTSITFLECTFVAIAESFLKWNKALLDQWQGGILEHRTAGFYRHCYVTILRDCYARMHV